MENVDSQYTETNNSLMAISALNNSPMFHLSSGSKELFHSNFLYWIGVTYRELFKEIMTRLGYINAPWPEDWAVRREYKHLDLCVTYNNDRDVFIVLENKVKSLPNVEQLRSYEKLFEGHAGHCTYIVLSLVKKFAGCKDLAENTIWQLHYYDELTKVMVQCAAKNAMKQEHHIYLSDYVEYVNSLSTLADSWDVDESKLFVENNEELRRLRLNDVYEKVRYGQMAILLANKLRQRLVVEDQERVILGMSNIYVIMKRSADAENILSFYGCTDPKQRHQVYIGSGMAHAVGLLEAKVVISDECCLVVQVQGNRYYHAVEQKDVYGKKLSREVRQFVDFRNCALDKLKLSTKLCHYGSDFVYRAITLDSTKTVGDIMDAMADDIINMMQ